MTSLNRSPVSYQDPSSFAFIEGKTVLRCFSDEGYDEITEVIETGLYEELNQRGLLVPLLSTKGEKNGDQWLFEQAFWHQFFDTQYITFDLLKRAALATLEVMEICLRYGFVLKDAKVDNIVFKGLTPALLDIGSISKLDGTAWVAYSQFVQQFVLPLKVMSWAGTNYPMNRALGAQTGVDVKVFKRLFKKQLMFDPSLWAITLGLGAGGGKKYSSDNIGDEKNNPDKNGVSTKNISKVIEYLRWTLNKTRMLETKSFWSSYSDVWTYDVDTQNEKNSAVFDCLKIIENEQSESRKIVDIGCNDGSRHISIHRQGRGNICRR